MKAQLNGIEIPWSVTSLDVLIDADQLKEYGESSKEDLIRSFNDGFNYLKGQIVEVGLTAFGKVPAIVTKVNERDENGHLTYDITILLGNRSKSFIESKERYLWRFTEKADGQTIPNFINLIEKIFDPDYGYDIFFLHENNLNTLCYLSGDSIISYDLRLINQTKELNLNDGITG